MSEFLKLYAAFDRVKNPKKMGSEPLGRHLLLDLLQCAGPWDSSHIQREVVAAIRVAGGSIIREVFHEFSPHGVSGVVVIAESHVAVHTWPESAVIAIDAFSCSDRLDLDRLVVLLKEAFGAKDAQWQVVPRGLRVP